MRAQREKKEKPALKPIRVASLRLNGTDSDDEAACVYVDEDDCRLDFCLTGHAHWRLSIKNKVDVYTVPAGYFVLFTSLGGCYRSTCTSKQSTRVLQVLIPCWMIDAFLGSLSFPEEIQSTSRGDEFICVIREITPPMNRIIASIQENLKASQGRDLLITAKALELFWILLSSETSNRRKNIAVEDRRGIQEALILLQDHMEDPPSLKVMANHVGMSLSKFKALFHKTCGMPPYEYLRKIRMEKAMALLIRGEMNVTEAAMEVGYSSISHFTKMFYKRFAIYPSQVKNI